MTFSPFSNILTYLSSVCPSIQSIDLSGTLSTQTHTNTHHHPRNSPSLIFLESMAPEQLERLQGGTLSSLTTSRQADLTFSTSQPLISSKETDIWALGIALLHLYLGKAPISDRPGDVRSAMTRVQSYVESKNDLGLSMIKETPIRVLLTSMLDNDVRKRPPLKAVALTLNIC